MNDQLSTPAGGETEITANEPVNGAAPAPDVATPEPAPTDPTSASFEPTSAADEPAPADPAPVAEVADTTASPEPETRTDPAGAEAAQAEASPVAPSPALPPEPVRPEPKPERAAAQDDDMNLFEAEMARMESGGGMEDDPSFKKLSKGDYVEATVIQVDRDRVFVDLGTKSEGIVPLQELTDENITSAEGHVRVGDRIKVVVLKPEGGDGNAIVSKKRADFEEIWDTIIASQQEGKTLNAMVVDRVKGGLVVDIGVRGFVPATHVGNGKLRNIEKYVGQAIDLKIIEIDRERKKVVLSNRIAEEEKREQVKGQIFDKVQPGDVLEGTVRRLADYGAFVDLGGIDGLLHISEMSWMRIQHPKEVLKEGQKIKVMVLRLDPANAKISLGLRQVLPDPWNLIRENYRIGQKIQCTISRLVQSGAFVKLPEGAEAFLPVSEISARRIAKPSDVLTEGQEAELTVIDLRPDERRMVLSLKSGSLSDAPSGGGGYDRGGSGGGVEDDDRRRGGPGKKGGKPRRGGAGGGRGRDDDDFDGVGLGRMPTGGATIGERLGMLKGFLRPDDEPEEEETAETADSGEEPQAPAGAESGTAEPASDQNAETPDEDPKSDEA